MSETDEREQILPTQTDLDEEEVTKGLPARATPEALPAA